MFENLRISFQGIWSHKMRSFLTMLGIIIGIASIIAIVSTIKGTSEQIKEDLIGAGNNTVSISLYAGDNIYDVEYGATGVNPPLLNDAQKQEIMDLAKVENVTFFYSRAWYSDIYYQNTNFSGGGILGIDEDYLDTCGYKIQLGRPFVASDYKNYRKVALVDNNAAENLFPGEIAIGKTLEIGSEPYVVVGVIRQDEDYLPNIESITEFYEYYQSMVGNIMIPSDSWPISFRYDEPMNVIIKADSTDNMSSAGSEAAEVLNKAIVNSGSTNYEYRADDIMERVKNLQKLSESTNQQLIWIAGISLIVGGIGVMNIMLVSVTERTREIGLKKAIGARRKTILMQFLTEASMLTSFGGMIGVVIGIGASRVISNVTGAPTAISVPAIVGSVIFSMLIGIIFGLMPSVKAANLNPIDALRSE